MKLVTIIVPVYNVEKYIDNCVKSIIEQDYKNLEIILVNDGSTDNSLNILKNYQRKDRRVKIINKENGGVSSARNRGIDKCSGDYLVFIDGDDYVEKNYVSHFVELIEKNKCDMAISYNSYGENYHSPKEIEKIITSESAIVDLYLNKINVAVWNKIYKTEFINKYNIRFKEDFWFAEGMTFNMECFQRCNKISTCDDLLYHQVANPESAVRKFKLENWHCGQKALEYQKENWIIKSRKINDAWNYHYRCYNASIWGGLIFSNQVDMYPNEIKKCKKGLKKYLPSCLRVKIPIKNKIRCIIEFIYPNLIYRRLYKKSAVNSK